MSGELSQFEQLSSVTPKKTPYAIMIGVVVFAIAVFIINTWAPTAGVSEMKEKAAKDKAKAAETAAPANDAGSEPADDL